jgi:hypothetical protein
MPMMATTIINSMSVKPFCSLLISKLLIAVPVRDVVVRKHTTPTRLTAVFASGMPSALRYVNFEGGARREAVLACGAWLPFDILRDGADRRHANNGHKLTKIVSGFRRRATDERRRPRRRYSIPSFLIR